MGGSIPRILHQHFLAGDAAIPRPVREVRDALRDANPGWTYSFWDAARAEAFIRDTYGEAVLSRYLRIRPEYYAARSDLLRYLVAYAQGGVYLDIKSTCERPLDEAIFPDDRFLLMHFDHMMAGARTPESDAALKHALPELADFPNGEYVQWVLATVPGHPYMRAVIARVLHNIDRYSPLTFGVGWGGTVRTTGPVPFSLAIEAIRAQHPHSGPERATARGFRDSGLAAGLAHRTVFGRSVYYCDLKIPVART